MHSSTPASSFQGNGKDPAIDAMVEWRDARDEGAARKLVNELSPQMHRVAERLLPFAWMAEDAVQTAWMKLFRSIDSFDPRIPVSAWAVMIVKRVCSNMVRGHRRHQAQALDELVDRGVEFITSRPSPGDHTIARERLAGVCAALDGMAEADREIFHHLLIDDQRPSEVARRTGLSTGALRVRMCRLRASLRALAA